MLSAMPVCACALQALLAPQQMAGCSAPLLCLRVSVAGKCTAPQRPSGAYPHTGYQKRQVEPYGARYSPTIGLACPTQPIQTTATPSSQQKHRRRLGTK
jgi:hypothetical protein